MQLFAVLNFLTSTIQGQVHIGNMSKLYCPTPLFGIVQTLLPLLFVVPLPLLSSLVLGGPKQRQCNHKQQGKENLHNTKKRGGQM